MKKIYRQGDIILKEVENLPQNLELISRESQFVLAEGETTGNKHTLVAKPNTMEILQDGNGRFYLKLSDVVELEHQEHKTIFIQPGIYEVGNEKEYDYFLEEIRKVFD